MDFYLSGDTDRILAGAQVLLSRKGFELNKTGIHVEVIENKDTSLEVLTTQDGYRISFGETVWFFRGLYELLRQLEEGREKPYLLETSCFSSDGMMLDCSRNAVPTVASIKSWITKLAMLGMNRLLLYMEDTYEVEGYPYFGYMRGRFSEQELKECDRYAELFGIEIVPCIQTLGHLRAVLKWDFAADIKDTDDILMVGEEKTYELLEKMIASVMKPLRTKRIHLGMDEAYGLGTGNYLRKNGYTDRTKLMNRHLERVLSICKDKGLEPMIWSDMYFNQHSTGGMYYEIDAKEDLSKWEKPPEEVSLVYWDYYNYGVEFYQRFLSMHKQLAGKTMFAGGAWTWNGLAPNQSLARQTTLDALTACKKEGIREVFCTYWGDNGSETPAEVGIPTLFLYGEEGFDSSEKDSFAKRFEFCFGACLEDYFLLEKFDTLEGTMPNNSGYDNASKQMLYQDILLGIFDKQVEGRGVAAHYKKLWLELQEVRTSQKQKDLFEYYTTLAELLYRKSEMGIRLKKAYDTNDRNELSSITTQDISDCIKLAMQLKSEREILWNKSNKPFGYEVIDIRFGGVITRLQTVRKRVAAYLTNEDSSIPELEEERLLYQDKGSEEHYHASCNRWEMIATPGNIYGM